jgi:hypothetical protein
MSEWAFPGPAVLRCPSELRRLAGISWRFSFKEKHHRPVYGITRAIFIVPARCGQKSLPYRMCPYGRKKRGGPDQRARARTPTPPVATRTALVENIHRPGPTRVPVDANPYRPVPATAGHSLPQPAPASPSQPQPAPGRAPHPSPLTAQTGVSKGSPPQPTHNRNWGVKGQPTLDLSKNSPKNCSVKGQPTPVRPR